VRRAKQRGFILNKVLCLNINSFLFPYIDEKQRKNSARPAVVADAIEAKW